VTFLRVGHTEEAAHIIGVTKEGIVPDNDLYISADAKSIMNSNIDEDKFNEIMGTNYSRTEFIFALGLEDLRETEEPTVQ
jgi:hypothetical protein